MSNQSNLNGLIVAGALSLLVHGGFFLWLADLDKSPEGGMPLAESHSVVTQVSLTLVNESAKENDKRTTVSSSQDKSSEEKPDSMEAGEDAQPESKETLAENFDKASPKPVKTEDAVVKTVTKATEEPNLQIERESELEEDLKPVVKIQEDQRSANKIEQEEKPEVVLQENQKAEVQVDTNENPEQMSKQKTTDKPTAKARQKQVQKFDEMPEWLRAPDSSPKPTGKATEKRSPVSRPSLISKKSAGKGGVSKKARILEISEPDYPRISRRLGEEGKVVLKLLISADGRVGKVRIVKSSGFSRLDHAAKQAALKARVSAALEDGVKSPSELDFTFHFRLND